VRPRRAAGWRRRLYLTLRTEHTTPLKLGLAVGIGSFLGFSPFWGLHLLLCVVAASLLRLNRMLVYAAANLANPATAPLLLFAEAQVGHHLLHGAWLDLTLHEVRAAGFAGLGMLFMDVLVGWAAAGAAVSLLLGAGTFMVSRTSRLPAAYQGIVDDVVRRYLDVSIRDAEGARARLLRDPIYPFLLAENALAGARVLDLGCGRALAAALGAACDALPHAYVGVDASARYVKVAREALGDLPGHRFVEADLRDFDPPPADLVLLVNVLRFLPVTSQDALLRRLAKSLPPGARVIVREVDASRGGAFHAAQVKDMLAALTPGRPHRRTHYRRAHDLRNALVAAGFEVRDRSTMHSTPRARVLLEAVRKPGAAPPAGA
jgi:uncharacterized protein (DUF2062 family)/SAM-dependent methyltransferase